MQEIAEKVSALEDMMMKLAYEQMNTQVALRTLSQEMNDFKDEMKDFKNEMKDFKDEMNDFKDEMKDFKDEMKDFKDEMGGFKDEMKDFKDEMGGFKDEMLIFKEETEKDRKQMNKQWGELAHKMGTVVEDIVAPNIPKIAREYFNCPELDDFMIRRQVRNKKDRTKRREFDVIAICEDKIFINETKSFIRIDYINDFIKVLTEVYDYFPECKGKKIIPIFSSLYLKDDIVQYLTKNKIYAMAMKDDTMDILNYKALKKNK